MKAILVTAMLLTPNSGAGAVEAGAAYAEQVCSPCHAVQPHQSHSPLPQAPSFQSIASNYKAGMTELALTVFMQSSHPTMPNLILKQEELRNVVAYIRSLKTD